MRPIETTAEGISTQPIAPGEVLVALDPSDIAVIKAGLYMVSRTTPGRVPVRWQGEQPVSPAEAGIVLNQFLSSDLSTK